MPRSAPGAPPQGTLELWGEVVANSYPGGLWRHSIKVGDEMILADGPQAFAAGEQVKLRIAPSALFLFDAAETTAGAETVPGAARPILRDASRPAARPPQHEGVESE